jgi:ADP-ribose pyrophosphatase
MALSRWKTLRRHVVSTNPWWEYRRDLFELPDGQRGEYHYVHTEGASMVLPLLDEGRVVMVRQFRYLCDRESLEFPCGGVKPGSNYLTTARQELAEEAGFDARELECVGEFNPYNGIADEICRVYVARYLTPAASHPDRTEEFERVIVTPEELEQWIASGEVWDGMTLAAWAIAHRKIASMTK